MNKNNFIYFFPKVKNRILRKRNCLLKHVNVELFSMRGYNDCVTAVSLRERLKEMLGVFDASLIHGIKEEDKKAILALANQTIRHEFDLLGSGPVVLTPIDWHLDFKSGNRWGKQFYLEIDYIKDADIKVPWELSRCQHLLWLGEAYMLTGETRFAKEVIDEIEWWVEDNPLMYTVNWKCAMDVAFRAVNWLFALNMISDYEGFDDQFSNNVSRSLWQHGFFIRYNLEKNVPNSGNHYTSDLVGLLYLGQLFNDTPKGRNWFKFAFKEYCEETLKQVLPSGVHYERSVSYHRMMTEMLSYPVYMLIRRGKVVPPDVMDRINSMYGYVDSYTKPNGKAPMIADADDGRFVPFIRRDFNDHQYLNDPQSIENILVSSQLHTIFAAPVHHRSYFPDAGVAVIKEGVNYVFFNHGGYSRKPSNSENNIITHSHNDLLSFELNINSSDIIVDPGTYLYTSSESFRNEFRATTKHNTAVVDDEEQNLQIAAFMLRKNVVQCPLKKVNDREYMGSYTTIKSNLSHQRTIKLTDNTCVISDYLKKSGGSHMAKLYFHFAPNLVPVIDNENIYVSNVRLEFSEAPSNICIINDNVSPSYGILKESKTAVVSFEFDESMIVITKIHFLKNNNG